MRRPLSFVVVGAGVVGASVAARLAASGAQVTLLDQDQPGRATSRWSFAWLNSNDKAPRHYHDLNHAGIRAWAELAPDLDGAAWHRPVGHVELATAEADLAARVQRLTEWGYPARLIDPAEALGLEPSLRPPPPGTAAAWFPGEAYVLTEPLIARLTEHATAHGAQILTGDRARVVAIDGAAPQVRTAAGITLQPDRVLCCAGRWTPAIAALAAEADAGDLVPLVPWEPPGATAPGLVVRAGPVGQPVPVRLLHTPDLSLRPHKDGQVHLEAPDAVVDLHTPEPELHRWATELLHRARRTIGTLDHAQITEHHVCVRPMPQDGHPIIGPLPGTPAVYVAVTHSGVTLAAHLSQLIAAELLTGTPQEDLAPYRPARFLAAAPPPAPSASGPLRPPARLGAPDRHRPRRPATAAPVAPPRRGSSRRPPRRGSSRRPAPPWQLPAPPRPLPAPRRAHCSRCITPFTTAPHLIRCG